MKALRLVKSVVKFDWSLIFVVFFGPLYLIIIKNCFSGSTHFLVGDYTAHIDFAKSITISELTSSGLPHLFIHLFIKKTSTILSVDLRFGFMIFTILSFTAATLLKMRIAWQLAPKMTPNCRLVIVGISAWMGAIFLPQVNAHPYLGVWSPLTYHNPTVIWLWPWALLSFYFLLKERYFAGALATGIATFIKPNFTLALLPGIFVLVFLRRISFKSMVAIAPSILILIFQYMLTFSGSSESSVGFSVAGPWSVYSSNITAAILQNLLGPILISVYLIKNTGFRDDLLFLWILTLIALSQGILLHENGPRFEGVNFIWGYTVIGGLLYFYSTALFGEHLRSMKFKQFSPWAVAIICVLTAQFLSGAFYLITFFQI